MRAGVALAAASLAAVVAAVPASAARTGTATLKGVSCTSPEACVAVGWSEASASQSGLLALKLQGGTWQIFPTPALAASPKLFGVSCRAPGACVTVGGAESGAIALRLAGGAWSPMSVPLKATLYGVSCPATDWCVAAGVDETEKRIVSMVLTGSTWQTVRTPVISGVSILTINALSCASRRFCIAVGDRTMFGPRVTVHPVALRFNGSVWRAVPVAAPGVGPSLQGVSCPVAGECIAVGNSNFYTGSPGRQLVMRYRAGRWTMMRAPGRVGTEPLAVSCTARDACVAVGSINLGASFVERLSHGTWSILPAQSASKPQTVGKGATVYDETVRSVSCLRRSVCVAVGGDYGSPFSELVGPGRATLLTVPVP